MDVAIKYFYWFEMVEIEISNFLFYRYIIRMIQVFLTKEAVTNSIGWPSKIEQLALRILTFKPDIAKIKRGY